jgi:hypothetical protein
MPKWNDLKRFCERDGWELYKDTDHYFYRKFMPDGNIKRTKISRGSGEIPAGLWKRIIKQQLQVSDQYFNAMI